jgi:hypothetical protein
MAWRSCRKMAALLTAPMSPLSQARAALRLTFNGLLYIATERSQATRVLSAADETAKKLNLSQPLGKGSAGKDGSEVGGSRLPTRAA